MDTGQPWPAPAPEAEAHKVSQALLESLQGELPEMDLAAHEALLRQEVAPWLALALDEPAHFEAELEDLTVIIADEIQQYGADQARDILREHALAVRLGIVDRWIKSSVRAVAHGQAQRASFTQAAQGLSQSLRDLDEGLRREHPGIRASFADQLSEMYLDLEFLCSGTPGSLRHAHLLEAQKEPS